jgi:hypothetical protein
MAIKVNANNFHWLNDFRKFFNGSKHLRMDNDGVIFTRGLFSKRLGILFWQNDDPFRFSFYLNNNMYYEFRKLVEKECENYQKQYTMELTFIISPS